MSPMVTVYTQSPWHNFSFLRVSSRNSCKRSAASELSLNCLHMSPEQVSCLTKKGRGVTVTVIGQGDSIFQVNTV